MKGMGEVRSASNKAYLYVLVCLGLGLRSFVFAQTHIECSNPNSMQTIHADLARKQARLADGSGTIPTHSKNNSWGSAAKVKTSDSASPQRTWKDVGEDLKEVSEFHLDDNDALSNIDFTVRTDDLVHLANKKTVRVERILANDSGKVGFEVLQADRTKRILVEDDFVGAVIERVGPDGKAVVVHGPQWAKGDVELENIEVTGARLLDARVIKIGSKIEFKDGKNPSKPLEVTSITVDAKTNQVTEVTLSDWSKFTSDGRWLVNGDVSLRRATIDDQDPGPMTSNHVVRVGDAPEAKARTVGSAQKRADTKSGDVEIKDPMAHQANKRPEPDEGQRFEEVDSAVIPDDGRSITVSRNKPLETSQIVFADGSKAMAKKVYIDAETFEPVYVELDTGRFLTREEFDRVVIDSKAAKASKNVVREIYVPPPPESVKLTDGTIATVDRTIPFEGEIEIIPPSMKPPSANWKKVGGFSGRSLSNAVLPNGRLVSKGDKITVKKVGKLEVVRIAKSKDKKATYIELSNGLVVRDAVFQELGTPVARQAKTRPPKAPSKSWSRVGGYGGKPRATHTLSDGRVVTKGMKVRGGPPSVPEAEVVRIAPAGNTGSIHFELSDGRVLSASDLMALMPAPRPVRAPSVPPGLPSPRWRHVGGSPYRAYPRVEVSEGRFIEVGSKVLSATEESLEVVRIARTKKSEKVFVELSNGWVRPLDDFKKMAKGANGEFIARVAPTSRSLDTYYFKDGRIISIGSRVRNSNGKYLTVRNIVELGKGLVVRVVLSDNSVVRSDVLARMKISDGVDFDDFLPEVFVSGNRLQAVALKDDSILRRTEDVLLSGGVRRRVQTIEQTSDGNVVIHLEGGDTIDASKLSRIEGSDGNLQIAETVIDRSVAEAKRQERYATAWSRFGKLESLKDIDSVKIDAEQTITVGDVIFDGDRKSRFKIVAIKTNKPIGLTGIELADGRILLVEEFLKIKDWNRFASPVESRRNFNTGETVDILIDPYPEPAQ